MQFCLLPPLLQYIQVSTVIYHFLLALAHTDTPLPAAIMFTHSRCQLSTIFPHNWLCKRSFYPKCTNVHIATISPPNLSACKLCAHFMVALCALTEGCKIGSQRTEPATLCIAFQRKLWVVYAHTTT